MLGWNGQSLQYLSLVVGRTISDFFRSTFITLGKVSSFSGVAGTRVYNVHTPSRKRHIKRVTRRSYVALASSVVNSPSTSKSVLDKVAIRIKSEMKALSSTKHDSILRDSVEAVKHFHWDTVMIELSRNLPTLMSLLSRLVGHPADRNPLLCLMASQILKSRHQHLGLVQRAVSVMMYGNGTAKQVIVWWVDWV